MSPRIMYDALYPWRLPTHSPAIASYIDGSNCPLPGWQSAYPGAIVVEIARVPTTDAGDVGDVESTDLTPEDCVAWVQLRRRSGANPALYYSEDRRPAIVAAFAAAGIPDAPWWLAKWDGIAEIPAGCIAKQYARGDLFDTSLISDEWAAELAGKPASPPPPPLTGSPEDMTESTKRVLVRLAYLASCGREPESQQTEDTWAATIADDGSNVDVAIAAITDSAEAQAYRTAVRKVAGLG